MANEEYSWFKFTLTGPVDIVYRPVRVQLLKAKYSVQSVAGGNIVDIELIAEFSPVTASKLAMYFPTIREGIKDGHYIYRFIMKDDIVKLHNKEFIEAIMPEDLLSAAKGACIRLENFECRGYGNFS
jgi:hypothetical protein